MKFSHLIISSDSFEFCIKEYGLRISKIWRIFCPIYWIFKLNY